jgi:hypothetical protein
MVENQAGEARGVPDAPPGGAASETSRAAVIFFVGLATGAALVALGVLVGVSRAPARAPVVQAAPVASTETLPVRETSFINFDVESTRQEMLGSGWGKLQPAQNADSLHWCEAKSCSVDIEVASGDARLIRVRWAPFHYPESQPQTAAAFLNGQPIGTAEVPPSFTVATFEAPGTLWKRGQNELKFDFAYAKAPKEVTADNPDPRTLSVFFDWVEVIRR